MDRLTIYIEQIKSLQGNEAKGEGEGEKEGEGPKTVRFIGPGKSETMLFYLFD